MRLGAWRGLRTYSEKLMAIYLGGQGIPYEYEHGFSHTDVSPDFWLHAGDGEAIVDVKELRGAERPLTGFAQYDPYAAIRAAIRDVRKQFKPFRQLPCCLALYNSGRPLADLRPRFVYGAMLGDLGLRVPVDRNAGRLRDEDAAPGFGEGGRMLRYRDGVAFEPQNTTISAVLTLERLRIGLRRFNARHEVTVDLDGPDALKAVAHAQREAAGTSSDPDLIIVRLSVCENPYARHHLPAEFFRGDFDERYGLADGAIRRLFVGPALEAVEREEAGPPDPSTG